mmetsp:Transcript_29352/g.90818  ORF Transcript_29352/g.90818 Transcript_29352/m.90818 type:complete len:599 (-) Transcript_29352:56-1852(-)
MALPEDDAPPSIWSYVAPETPYLVGGGCALVVSAFSNAFAPRAMGRVVDAYALRAKDGGRALRGELGLAALVFGCGAVASGIRVGCFATACQNALKRLRDATYEAALSRDLDAQDEAAAAAAADAVDKDAKRATAFLTESAQNGLRYCSSVCNGCWQLGALSPRLSLELLAFLPLSAGLVRTASKLVGRRGDAAEAAERAAVSVARSRLAPGAKRAVKALGAEGFEADRFAVLTDAAACAGRRHGLARGAFIGALDCVGKMTVLGVVFRGGAFVESGAMSGGDLLAFALYAGYAGLGLAGLAKVAATERRAYEAAAASLRCALTVSAGDRDAAATALLDGDVDASFVDDDASAPALELVDATFAHAGRDATLVNCSLKLQRGRSCALVGASGAGKSTLLSLALGLRSPDVGTVRVFGRDLSTLSPKSLGGLRRFGCSCLEQRAPLLAAGPTVADAVAYGDDAPDSKKVEEAADACAGFMRDVPGGLAASLDGGAALSGGQRARIAASRAFYRSDASLLLLDEPTASLDAAAEAATLTPLLGAAKARGAAVLLVSHNRAAVARCDDVAVLEGGTVVEAGEFGKLAANPNSRLNELLLLE